jgi:small GTP-binding protein
LWDTSGSERYRAITTGHYRDALGAILVCDLTSMESFTNLEYWISAIKEHADKHVAILLVGKKKLTKANKYDLVLNKDTNRIVSD